MIARFVTQALAGEPLTVFDDGAQSRSFTYVADAVEATLRAGTRPEAVGEVFNVGSAVETTVIDVAHRVIRAASSASEITFRPVRDVYGAHFEDTRRRVPDVSKAERRLGFRATVGLDEGIAQTIRWWSDVAQRA